MFVPKINRGVTCNLNAQSLIKQILIDNYGLLLVVFISCKFVCRMSKSEYVEWTKALSEIETVLENYGIILTQTDSMSLSHDNHYRKQLFYIIFGRYLPTIKKETEKLENERSHDKIDKVKSLIEKMERQHDNKNSGLSNMSLFSSPIVLLLKLAEESNCFSFAQKEECYQRQWGRLASFRQYLDGLRFQDSNTGPDRSYYPGLPSCILSLAPIWTSHESVISASQDRFEAIESLRDISHSLRTNQVQFLHDQCIPEVQIRIKALKEASKTFCRCYKNSASVKNNQYITETEYHLAVMKSKVIPVHFPGMFATWSPTGRYMPSCLLDYCRFRSLRPPMAEKLDQEDWVKIKQDTWIIKKKMWGISSCAEWAALLQLAHTSNNNVDVTEASLW